jgi:hypothetical protein
VLLTKKTFICNKMMKFCTKFYDNHWSEKLFGRNVAGFDDMITIFSILTIFGEKMALLSKTNVMIKFLHNLFVFQVKNAIFRRKYLKNHNIGPWMKWAPADNWQNS